MRMGMVPSQQGGMNSGVLFTFDPCLNLNIHTATPWSQPYFFSKSANLGTIHVSNPPLKTTGSCERELTQAKSVPLE